LAFAFVTFIELLLGFRLFQEIWMMIIKIDG